MARAFDNEIPVVDTPEVVDDWDVPCKVEVLDENTTTRLAIKNGNATEDVIAQMREKVNKRNKGLSVLIDENKGNSAARLSEALATLDEGVISSDILERVRENIQTPKDLLDYAKAIESINSRMIKQATTTADADKAMQGANGIKIGLAFKDGTVALGVSTGGDE